MSLDPKILREVLAERRESLRRREEEYRARRRQVYVLDARLEELARERRSMAAQMVSSALRQGGDPEAAVEAARRKSALLRREEEERLQRLGFPRDYLEERPQCPHCGDTGYLGTEPCQCLLRLYAQRQQQQLSRMLDVTGQSFEQYDLSLFSNQPSQDGLSDRELMRRIRDYCQEYCRAFGGKQENLFLTGQCGTGKTFLSGCIAREVSAQGYSVCYDTAVRVFSVFEAERFEHSQAAGEEIERYLKSDLFILDDLGTEFTSPFTVSALYTIVNTRLITGGRTIINTNLTLGELPERYSPQIHSRIAGTYRTLYLRGRDLRLR